MLQTLRNTSLAVLGAALFLTPTAAAGDDTPVFSDPLASTNELVPIVQGLTKVYVGRDEGDALVVIDLVLAETRTFFVGGVPVETHILKEIEFEDGELVEISCNYFAEADDGTVYYFGETVDNYEDGEVVDHDGSWLVGGATLPSDPPETAFTDTPAVFMPFEPDIGDHWKPEDIFPLVDETVTVKADDTQLKVIGGCFEEVMRVEESSDLPDTTKERKWYARGVGFIKARGKGERLELIASTLVQEDDDE